MGIESLPMIRYVTGDVIAACIVPKIGYTMLASCVCAFVVVAVFRKKMAHVSLKLKISR